MVVHGNSDYTVGWISALSIEYSAAIAFLDEVHGRPENLPSNDNNFYTLGRIGGHNVVMAVMPNGEYGLVSAACVASDMMNSFPEVRALFMVGIGGGAPSAKHDIRLGDIVVGAPGNTRSGVIQYDFGKTIQQQAFHMTRHLSAPPLILQTAVAGLRARHRNEGNRLNKAVHEVLQKQPRLRTEFAQPDRVSDRLYRSDVIHHPGSDGRLGCEECCGNDPSSLVQRQARGIGEDEPVVHYGLIASSNQLMKDAMKRDYLAEGEDVLCFEMEAAGLMRHFPCLVVRGICDYSDTHKNKTWQGHASMVAAAYCKSLIGLLVPRKVEKERSISSIMQSSKRNTRICCPS